MFLFIQKKNIVEPIIHSIILGNYGNPLIAQATTIKNHLKLPHSYYLEEDSEASSPCKLT